MRNTDKLLDYALKKAPEGRNRAGYLLAVQLHANGFSYAEAADVMRQYAMNVCNLKDEKYTIQEALSTLSSEYKRVPLAPSSTPQPERQRYSNLSNFFPLKPPSKANKIQEQESQETAEQFNKIFKTLKSIKGTEGEKYLNKRGIKPFAYANVCAYCEDFPILGKAVVFSIKDADGQHVAINARSIESNEKRTYGKKSLGIFATQNAFDSFIVALTEAPIDALSLHSVGIPAIATCGTSDIPDWTAHRLQVPLLDTQRTILLAFDNDEAGEEFSKKMAKRFMNAKVIRYKPRNKDWNEDLLESPIELNKRLSLDFFIDAIEVVKKDNCEKCGKEVFIRPYYGTNYGWYECQNCEELKSIELIGVVL